MRCKLIILFLFFEINVFCVTTENINRNETFMWTASQKNQPNATSFVLINPKQIQHAERIIEHFLTRLIGPIAQPITLRLTSNNGSNLESTISEISNMIRAKIMEFARTSGLITSVRQYEQTLWNSTTSKGWFTEGLVQGSFLLGDLIRIGEEVQSAINHYFKTYNMILYKEELLPRTVTTNFKFFSIINDAASFNKKLFKCLLLITDERNSTLSFNLNRALANLAKESPNITVKSFKSSLDRAFIRSAPSNDSTSEQLYMLLCQSLVERISHYGDCIKELRRFVTCVSSSSDQDWNGAIGHHRIFAKPWLSVIQHLSGCKINIDEDGNANIRCKFYRRLPKSTTRQVKYIYEKILDQRIPKRSSLHHVANELGNLLSRSRWGRQLTYDICQYFAIYQEGQRRLNILSKNAVKDKKAAIRYKKMSISLNIYKNGVLRKTMLAVENVHHSALEMQKYFIHGIRNSFNESWQNHLKVLACLSEWMTKVLELFGCTNLNDTDVDTSISTDIPPINMTDSNSANDELDENNETKHLIIYSRKNQIKKETDITFEKLMQSMNHMSKMRSQNDKSTLACLANNLLLVTMFMETISFVSTLFCLGDHKDESNFEQEAED